MFERPVFAAHHDRPRRRPRRRINGASRVTLPLILLAVILAVAAGWYVGSHRNAARSSDTANAALCKSAPTDMALVKYREIAPIPTGLKQVGGIAVGPNDTIYVTGNSSIRVFDKTGRQIKQAATIFPLACIAIADDGTVYAGINTHLAAMSEFVPSGMAVLGPDLTPLKTLLSDTSVTCIAVAGENVYVTDAFHHVILRLDKSGKLLNRIAEKNPAKGIDGLVVPSAHLDVAVGPDGQVRVANPGRQRIETYTPDGEYLGAWGKSGMQIDGFSGCCNPADFAILPDGRFVTSEKGIPRVNLYSAEGKFECAVAPHEAFPNGCCSTGDCSQGSTRDVAVDRAGRILVLDPDTASVRIFVKKETGASK